MKVILTIIISIVLVGSIFSQPNCNIYLWQSDTLQYKACKHSIKFNDYYQFDMKGIAVLDSCLAICPYYADANYEYGVVYLKAGNFIGWNKYINAAVKYDAANYLGLRASCRGKFFADYTGAINDIDSLASIVNYDIGFVHDGTYHLDAYKALCYKALNKNIIAIELFEKHLIKNSEFIGLFDYLHLGVAYHNIGNYSKAIDCFSNQEKINNLAENNYYKAKSYLKIADTIEFDKYIHIANELIKSKQKMIDGYHIMEDEIFMSDIQNIKELVDNIR